MKPLLRVGQRVNVIGEVIYGDTWYDVNSKGDIMELEDGCCLVNLDEIDGDFNVSLIVENKYIFNIQ